MFTTKTARIVFIIVFLGATILFLMGSFLSKKTSNNEIVSNANEVVFEINYDSVRYSSWKLDSVQMEYEKLMWDSTASYLLMNTYSDKNFPKYLDRSNEIDELSICSGSVLSEKSKYSNPVLSSAYRKRSRPADMMASRTMTYNDIPSIGAVLDRQGESSMGERLWQMPPLPNRTSIIKTKVKELKKDNVHGDFNFCMEDTMQVKVTYKARLIVSQGIPKFEILKSFSPKLGLKSEDTKTDSIPISDTMIATLKEAGQGAFSILQTGNNPIRMLSLGGGAKAIWEWTITPLEDGNHLLVLDVSNVTSSGNSNISFIPAKDMPVHVYAESIPVLVRLGNFASGESTKLFGMMLTSLICFFFSRYLDKKKKKTVQDIY